MMKIHKLVVILLISFFLVINAPSTFSQTLSYSTKDNIAPTNKLGLKLHEPIMIQSNNELLNQSKAENWPGNGTKDHPFIIANYLISNGTFGILIRYTTYFIQIENNTLEAGNKIGIQIQSAYHVQITNNFISNTTDYGIFIIQSSILITNNRIESANGLKATLSNNVIIKNNTFNYFSKQKINFSYCTNSTVQDNGFFNTDFEVYRSNNINFTSNIIFNLYSGTIYIYNSTKIGLDLNDVLSVTVELYFANNNTITNNTLLNGEIYFYWSIGNIIQLNRIEFGNRNAIYLQYSDQNTFKNNIITNIRGIYFLSSSSNVFIGNYFRNISQLISTQVNPDAPSEFNHFSQNNFLDSQNDIFLGNYVNYFDNGKIGNYWSANTNNETVFLVFNAGIKLYDNHTLQNMTFTPNSNITLFATNVLVSFGSQFTNSTITLPVGVTNTKTQPSTSTQPYYPPVTNYPYTSNPPNYSYSSSSYAVTSATSSPINSLIIIFLIVVGGIALGYVYITKKKYQKDQFNNYNSPEQYSEPINRNYDRSTRYISNRSTTITQQNQIKINYCPNCHYKAETGDIFCMQCGHRL